MASGVRDDSYIKCTLKAAFWKDFWRPIGNTSSWGRHIWRLLTSHVYEAVSHHNFLERMRIVVYRDRNEVKVTHTLDTHHIIVYNKSVEGRRNRCFCVVTYSKKPPIYLFHQQRLQLMQLFRVAIRCFMFYRKHTGVDRLSFCPPKTLNFFWRPLWPP